MAITSAEVKYPELFVIAKGIANETCKKINRETMYVSSSMPYKAQCVLEMVIQILEERV